MTEFLPLCDVLFNVISLAGYFCDVVFDVVLGYALYERGRVGYFTIVLALVFSSLIVSQIVSLRWYWNGFQRGNHHNLQHSRNASVVISAATGAVITTGTTTSSTITDSLEKKNLRNEPPIENITGSNNNNNIIINNNNNNNNLNNNSRSNSGNTNNNNLELLDCNRKYQNYAVIILHCAQLGVLWRYAKLFVPVDLRRVKHEVRDLCMLRLVHAFCEAAPMLLLQLYLLITIQNDNKFLLNLPEMKLKSLSGEPVVGVVVTHQQSIQMQQQTERTFKDLNIVSAALSLFSVCWALASFSKNVRLQNVHRLVLTWLGVIFQFLWRLGTVASRIASLTVYASFYKYWVFLVIVLHWFSMFLWLISPKNVFHGERISKLRKMLLSALIAFVYIFAYINLQEVNHRQKMFTFYIVMFLENTLLVCLWLVGVWQDKPEDWHLIPILILSSFAAGMSFMVLYYRYFHIRRLGYEAGGRCENESRSGLNSKIISEQLLNGQPTIAGVFNCRFSNPVGNAATKRKKKKPTTFVPPPSLGLSSSSQISNPDSISNGPMSIPFWRRPLPRSQNGGSSENEGSVGSRVNIHQKLQEKKQKQLAELKIIEEEIKQGKLGGPSSNNLPIGDDGRTSLPRQPIPRTKKHINLDSVEWCSIHSGILKSGSIMSSSNFDESELNNLNKFQNTQQQCDQIYTSFGLSGINIPALEQQTNNLPNMSPIPSSQVSATESNSLTRQVPLRSKIPHNPLRNPFTESYRNIIQNQITVLPTRNLTNSPGRSGVFDHINHQNIFLEVNHPRQISGTYSNCAENSNMNGIETLVFPYNVVPPPRSKLDNRSTPSIVQQPASQQAASMMGSASITSNKLNTRQLQRAKTPEVLLAPHYLDNSRVYYDWMARESTTYRIQDADRNHVVSSGDENLDVSAADESILGGNRIPSDIDSQVSLPRSYTLPREFKYYRRNKIRKFTKNEHIISTNSSDGDVDSADDNESERLSDTSQCRIQQQVNPRITNKIPQSNYHHPRVNQLRNYRKNQQQQQQQQMQNNNNNSNNNNHNFHSQRRLLNGDDDIVETRNNNCVLNPTSNNLDISGRGIIINNLDLINGVEGNISSNNSISNSNFVQHSSRLRVYPVGKHNIVSLSKHETKL